MTDNDLPDSTKPLAERSAANQDAVLGAAIADPTGDVTKDLIDEPKSARTRSAWGDAWLELRGKPTFWIAAGLIAFLVAMSLFPQIFTSQDPTFADLSISRQGPSPEHIFGVTDQGYDVFARSIYGARASISVAVFATLFTVIIGSTIGLLAGFYGGWLDAVLSRFGEVFLGIPLLLAGILFLYTFPAQPNEPFAISIGKIVTVIALFQWPIFARMMRSSVLQVKPNEYVLAAKAMGAKQARLIFSHVLPNAIAPVMVVAALNLGQYVAVEATLSFLGIGLQPPTVSWGLDVSNASAIGNVRSAPHMLIFPSIFVSMTVLSFIILSDAIRDALDPKSR